MALRVLSSTLPFTAVVLLSVGVIILFTFILQILNHDGRRARQLCLILGFAVLIIRKKDYKWEKIEDVRLITNGDII